MTEPTDAELRALLPTKMLERDKPPKVQVWLTQKDALAFARAVLAKWGMPPAVAGEPVAWRHRMGPTDIWVECSKEFHDWVVREPSVWPRDEVQALCIATPQPTQAQAGAVPLTDERVDAAVDTWFSSAANNFDFRVRMRAAIDAAHGIKGGQHGSNT